jgi:hypothetical protein
MASLLTLDLAELQVVESVKKTESGIRTEKAESCELNSLASKASEARAFFPDPRSVMDSDGIFYRMELKHKMMSVTISFRDRK